MIVRGVFRLVLGAAFLLPIGAQPPASAQGGADASLHALVVERPQVPDFLGWVEDELVVVLGADLRAEIVVTEAGGRPVVSSGALQAVIDRHDLLDLRRQFRGARPQPESSTFPDLTGHYKLRVPEGSSLEQVIAELEAVPGVARVERIGVHTLSGEPNDPYFRDSPNSSFPYDQWHLWNTHSIDAELAWDSQTGAQEVLVGILDSGVRYFHLDLGGNSPAWGPGAPYAGGNVFVNTSEIPGNGVDDDGNGYVDDTIGWDFVQTTGGGGVNCIDQDCGTADNDPDDGNGHGTHVAGTVAAITHNARLVSGVAGGFSDGTTAGVGNGCRVVPLRIGYHATYFGQVTGVVRMDYAAEAMAYLADLVDAGRNVAAINCSWGSSDSGGLSAAVDALQAREVLVVHAAGNSNSSSADFLGGKAGVMNVSATDIAGRGASFTNYGSWVDVAAPGVDVLSTYRNPDDPDPSAHYIALLSGTSMAAPHVAGIAALLESCNPALGRVDKFNLIVGNVDPYTDTRPLGSGIANAAKALAAASCSSNPCDLAADFAGSPTSGCAALAVAFNDLSVGSIGSWSWDFGDGSSSTLQDPSHTYAAAGTYSVSLTVSGATCSDTETKSAYVTVGAQPIAAFSGTPTSGSAPLAVAFTDLSSGQPDTWSWNFGDGSGSTARNPSHTYSAAGTYTVTLTASNACGSDAEIKSGYITVSEPSPASAMHVASIVVGVNSQSQGNKQGFATVVVVDDQGTPVAGALVSGTFSGDFSGVRSGTTGSNGSVTLTIGPKKGRTNFTFCVDQVSHASLTYAPQANVETCDSTQ